MNPRILLAAGTLALATFSTAGATADAQTGSAMRPASVQSVCAASVYVRQTAAGVVIGTLVRGDNFDHTGGSSTWWYGHAYGNVHQDGYVLASAFSGC